MGSIKVLRCAHRDTGCVSCTVSAISSFDYQVSLRRPLVADTEIAGIRWDHLWFSLVSLIFWGSLRSLKSTQGCEARTKGFLEAAWLTTKPPADLNTFRSTCRPFPSEHSESLKKKGKGCRDSYKDVETLARFIIIFFKRERHRQKQRSRIKQHFRFMSRLKMKQNLINGAFRSFSRSKPSCLTFHTFSPVVRVSFRGNHDSSNPAVAGDIA